jgi:tetratricopeptide (TPR) repeat protein/nucleoside phosphorylase
MPHKADVLIVTVTKVESSAVFQAFKQKTGIQATAQSIEKRIYFDLGIIDNARIFLTQSEPGSGGLDASLLSVSKGIETLSPIVVIMVGIAFGVNEEEQAIGDILVAQQLNLYDLQRLGTQDNGQEQIILRGGKPTASPWLINHFRSADMQWDVSKVHFGTVLTGEKLVDNIDYRNQLHSFESEAIGGEMEGAGLYVACQDKKVDWILVKGICDWADGNKVQDRESRQKTAANNAATFVLYALQFGSIDWQQLRHKGSQRSELSEVMTDTDVLTSVPPRILEEQPIVDRLQIQLAEIPSIQKKIPTLAPFKINRQSPMRSRVPDEHYIERDDAKRLLDGFAIALKQPHERPLLFNIYGIGGVGKTTLLGRLKDVHASEVDFLEICFAKTGGIENPLKLMRRLHQQAIKLLDGQNISDTFTEQDRQFEKILYELSRYSLDGTANSNEDEKKIISWFERLIWLGSIGLTATSRKSISLEISGAGFSTSTMMEEDAEGLKEWIQQRVRNHPTTKNRPDLQSLMLEPVSQLTQAFANSLMQISQSRERSLVLVLDTYEKAQSYLNKWLWQYLVEDTSLYSAPVRIVVVGRRSLQADEDWRKLHQDRKLLYEVQLMKFNKKTTDEYLRQIRIENGGVQAKIFKATQGLPYYLNWVREQQEKGLEPDFSKGNQAIVELLLQGIDIQKRKILQIVSCCRWFDLSIIKFLLKGNELGLQQNSDESENYFEWLKQSDFVEFTKGHFCFDDVARDVFRQAYSQEDRTQFRKTNALLAEYFKQQADKFVDPQSLLPDSYEDEDWRGSITEFLYYSLFGKGNEGLQKYVEHIFASSYLSQPDTFLATYVLIRAEINEDNQHLLPATTNKFLKESLLVLNFGWQFLNAYPIIYEIKDEIGNFIPEKQIEEFSKQVETSIQSLLGHVDNLKDGIGKCIGAIYRSLRCNNRLKENVDLLRLSKNQSKLLIACCRPKLTHSILLNICNLFVAAESYEDSLSCYQNLLELDPYNVSTYTGQGFALFGLKLYEEALASYQKAIDIDPQCVDAWTNKAATLINLRQYQKALESSQKAINIDPRFINAWRNKGTALFGLDRYEEALTSYQKAIDIDPLCVNTLILQGILLFEQDLYDKVIENSQKLIDIYPESIDAWINRGAAFSRLNRHEEALESYQTAIGIAPQSVNAWTNKGSTLIDLKQYKEALESSQKAIDIDPRCVNAWVNRGAALSMLDRHAEALISYQKAIDIDPNSTDALTNKGATLINLKRYEEALISYQRVIHIDSKSVDAWNRSGSALSRLARHEEALESYQKAIDIDPQFINSWLNRGAALFELERYKEALTSYQKVIDIDSKHIDAWNRIGDALFELEQYEEALINCQKVIDIDPQSINALNRLGNAFSELERYDEALEISYKVTDLDANFVDGWNRRGVILLCIPHSASSIT